MLRIAAEVLGGLAILVSALAFGQKDRKKILGYKFVSDILWVANYGFLGAFSGMVMNAISALREVVFYHRDKSWGQKPFWLPLFLVAGFVSAALSWQGLISILPALGTAILIFGFYNKNSTVVRLLSLPGNGCWLLYACLCGNVTAIIGNGLAVAVGLWSILRYDILKTAAAPNKGEDR